MERSVSHAGLRRFKDLRAQLWPSPGVFTAPELALRIVRRCEEKLQARLLPEHVLSELETLSHLSSMEPDASPLELLSRCEQADVLHRFGLDPLTWSEVARECEEASKQPELKVWTERIIAHLRRQSLAKTRHLAASPWTAVEIALAQLEHPNFSLTDLEWSRVLARPPHATQAARLVVVETSEAYPLEAKFIRALQQRLKRVEILRPLPGELQALPEVSQVDASSSAGIYWARPEPEPSHLETALLIPGSFELDLPEPRGVQGLPIVRALNQLFDFHLQGQPAGHPYLRGTAMRNILEQARFPTDRVPTLEMLRDFLLIINPLKAHELHTLRDSETRHLPEWLRVLARLDYFQTQSPVEIEASSQGRASPNGMSFLCLRDLPFGGHQNALLWGTQESLSEMTDPSAPSTVARRSFPPRLTGALEARGVIVPDPSREALMLRDMIAERENLTRLLTRPAFQDLLPSAPPRISHQLGKRHLSPSSLESFFRCPFQFYAGRVLGLKPDPDWDPEKVDALSKGRWLHKALETFFASPSWNEPADVVAKLENYLRVTINESFGDRLTAAYQRLLEAQAHNLAETLARYALGFERQLQDIFPTRRFEIEKTLEGSLDRFGDVRFRGTVDRLDVLGANGDFVDVLLWDYKTGSPSQTKALKQVEEGHIQWFFYRRLVETLSPRIDGLPLRVVGGGYLNPLRPEKSALFVNESTSGRLEQTFKDSFQNFEVLSAPTLVAIEETLDRVVGEILVGLRAGHISPTPRKKSECTRCDFQALCGRPYLEREAR